MYEEENIEPEFLKRPKKNPFQTPDYYFDSIEDRVMGAIEHDAKNKTYSNKVFQFLKPVLGLAASFTIIYMLAYYPFKYFSPKSMVKSETIDTATNNGMDFYLLAISLLDENTLVNAIFNEEKATQAEENPDEVLAYLSSEMNDLEIYTEIQK